MKDINFLKNNSNAKELFKSISFKYFLLISNNFLSIINLRIKSIILGFISFKSISIKSNLTFLKSFIWLLADADVVDGQDGMLLVTVLVGTHHAEVKVELDGLPCLLRVDVMLDLISSDYFCYHNPRLFCFFTSESEISINRTFPSVDVKLWCYCGTIG